MIAPPLNATSKAFSIPLLAASAVLTFALTLIFIPIYPARPDKIAPTKNPIAVSQSRTKPKIRNKTTPTTDMVVYCLFR